DEHNKRQWPRSRRVKKYYPAHDGVGIGGTERGRIEHRQHVCRDVADRRGDDECPGVLYRMTSPPHELPAAAGTLARLGRTRRPRKQAAEFAGNESRLRSGKWHSAHRTIFHV